MLIVDDEDAVREVLADMLSLAGYAVELAEDGAMAKQRLALPPLPDLVLCDLDMPGTSGFELCPWVQEHCRVPVILVSGRGDLDLVALRLKPAGLVSKPVTIARLLEAVRAVLGG